VGWANCKASSRDVVPENMVMTGIPRAKVLGFVARLR
jgi:hypothetical protein